MISRALLGTRGCVIIVNVMQRVGRGVPREVHLPPVDPVEFLRRLCVVLRVLSSNGKTHGVSPSNITSDHPLVRNILPNLLPQLCLDLQILQRIIPSLRVRRRRRTAPAGFEGVQSDRTGFQAEARTREWDALNRLCGGR